MHLGKFSYSKVNFTSHTSQIMHSKSSKTYIRQTLHLLLVFKIFTEYAFFFKLVFLMRWTYNEMFYSRNYWGRPDHTINRKFAQRSPANTKVRQSASECVHAEVHASVDNSWLQAYVGDLMVRTSSWGRPASQMVIWGFGLVKHSGIVVQIRSLFKKWMECFRPSFD